MSVPDPNKPGQSSVGAGQIVLIVCGILGLTALVCCGGLGVLGAIFYTRAERTVSEINESLQKNAPPPVANLENDWFATQALTTIYTMVIDAAIADARLVERLGEPIETVDNESSLFRREQSGPLTGGEVFEFDLRGPKEKATIRVECSTSREQGLYQPTKVIARFGDDSELELPTPTVKPRYQ